MLKTAKEIELMREGGKKLHDIREELLRHIKIGKTPLEIDQLAKKMIAKSGGTPSFMTVNDYQYATCIAVNDVVVHGIPTKEPFVPGDVVGLDVGLLYKGFHTDTSWSIQLVGERVGEPTSKEVAKFLKTGEEALRKAIQQAKPGNRIGHISKAIQDEVEASGYSVVRSLVGHGVGRELHESPQIPGLLTKSLTRTPELKVGMVIAIEVIYNMGSPEIGYKNDDGWTLSTIDGQLSGLFEQTMAILPKGPIILT